MKKWLKITLIVLVVLIAAVVIIGYKMYQFAMGNEQISGTQGEIPTEVSAKPGLTFGTHDWPNWRGDNLDGRSTVKGIKKDWSKGLKEIWKADYLCQGEGTAAWSTPVIQGNRLVIPGRDSEKDLIFCFNSETGKLIWKKSYKAPAETNHGPGARATPWIDSNIVYTFGRSGDFIAWDLNDGKQIWKTNMKDHNGAEPHFGYSTSPLVLGDEIFMQGGGNALVIAFNKNTGEPIWKSMVGDAGYAAATSIEFEGKKHLLVYHAVGLSCIDPENGRELWQVPWLTNHGNNCTTPVVEGDIIFHSAAYGMGSQAIRADADGYKVLWKNPDFFAQHSDPYIFDGYIYGYSGESIRNKGQFKCVELATGKEMWSTEEIGQGTCVWVDGHFICLNLDGDLFLVKQDPKSFKKVGEIKGALADVEFRAWTAPIIANGKLYLRYMQQIVCYDLMK